MKFTFILLTLVLTVLFFACSGKNPSPAGDNNPTGAPGNTGPTFSDSGVSYLYQHRGSASDSIDSTGTYFKRNDTLFWVMRSDTANPDTIPEVVTVTGDTAVATGIFSSAYPMRVIITGVLVNGNGGLFEGSVWKVVKIGSYYGDVPLVTGTSMYIYFDSTNHKVYTLDNNDAYDKLVKSLLLTCPLDFAGAMITSTMPVVIDSLRSSCDTLFATGTAPVVNYYAVSNFDSLSIDVYMEANDMFLTRIPVALP
ncbi:MAG: hypothetical protein V1913_01865 [Fibrobacterota bacterium]